MRSLLKTTAFGFALSGILFLPFPFVLFPYQAGISEGLFGHAIRFFIERILNIEDYYPFIVSDSLMMYVLLFLLFIMTIFIVVIARYSIVGKILNTQKLKHILRSFFSYYLALMLVKYGADKLFWGQFYLPEPNILYTPFGYLDKDILFWSVMGTSHSYNIFIGLAQLITAFLLLFHKTRIVGAIFSVAIFVNIVAINFSFDISVKLYSIFLLFLSLLLLSPFFSQLYSFLILKKASQLPSSNGMAFLYSTSFFRTFIKTFVILLIILEAFYPNLKTKSAPFLHGGYQTASLTLNDKEQDLRSIPFKRLFIHRDNYLIFQNHDDEMSDYKLQIDRGNSYLILTDYSLKRDTLIYQYSIESKALELVYFMNGEEYSINMMPLNYNKLPVMKNYFHWTIDKVQ